MLVGLRALSAIRWAFPLALRALVVWQLAWPASSKFVDYSSRVRDFEDHGIPNPEAWVLIVGSFEVVALISAVTGAAPRIAMLPMIPIMIVAIGTAGLESGNAMVLAGCLGIVLFGSGPFSLWNKETQWLRRPLRDHIRDHSARR